MRFYRRAAGDPQRLAILSGSFNPPTRAHMALASAALESGEADETLLVLPERFPHKEYEGPDRDARLRMLLAATASEPRFSVAISPGGLFLEIARDCRASYGSLAQLLFLCGRDAAERIVGWDYHGQPDILAQLREYKLLVAPRDGVYVPPPGIRNAVRHLPMAGELENVSASEIRRRIRSGEDWEQLAPEAIVEHVRELY